MKNKLPFSFTADKATNTVFITRGFDAGLSLVWDAFTKQEILDQWGAPAPYTVRTISMDFRVGGRRLFAMVGLDGTERYSIQDYTAINPKTNLQYISSFGDKEGNLHPELNGSLNNLNFSEENGITTLRVTIKYKTLAILEMMVANGFREGLAMTWDNLEKLLPSLK